MVGLMMLESLALISGFAAFAVMLVTLFSNRMVFAYILVLLSIATSILFESASRSLLSTVWMGVAVLNSIEIRRV
jgi:hypothetical protein